MFELIYDGFTKLMKEIDMKYLDIINSKMDIDFDWCEVVEEKDGEVIVECGVFGIDEIYEFVI